MFQMLIPLNLFRALCIGIAFIWVNPEILSAQAWMDHPLHNIFLVGTYFLLAFAAEIYYRTIIWGRLYPKKSVTVVPPPKLCCDQWSPICEKLPPVGKTIEAYCLNGLSIPAFLALNQGRLELTLHSEHIGELQRYESHELRPTHWRPIISNLPKGKLS